MNNLNDLFIHAGKDDFYELLRKKEHKKHHEIKYFLNNSYGHNQRYLDDDFRNKIKNEFIARLWELTICDYLRLIDEIFLLQHKEYTIRGISTPDFCFIHQNKKYYVELVTISPGSCTKLGVSLQDSLGTSHKSPRIEYKQRFCSVLKDKTDKFRTKYSHIVNPDDGFIIAVSSGN